MEQSTLEKLVVAQLAKKSPDFYGTRRFTTEFSRVHHTALSWACSVQSI